jgi:hypothetical protein
MIVLKEFSHFQFVSEMLITCSFSEIRCKDEITPVWAILMVRDRGPESDTPEERQITITKNPTTIGEQKRNEELSQIRVWIECFFGRMQQLFAIMRGVYRWDHRNFDMDFEDCALSQTNTSTTINSQSWIESSISWWPKKGPDKKERMNEKRKAQLENFKNRKKLKLTTDTQQLQE